MARSLRKAVIEYLGHLHLERHMCRIDARVYANLKGLSSEIVKKPPFPRALAGFAAGFSREGIFSDFVDVVDELAVEDKIVGT